MEDIQWHDLFKAIRDLQFELLLTAIMIVVLVLLGFWFGWWSHRRKNKFTTHDIPGSGLLFAESQKGEWLTDFLQGISTEMVGAIITTVLFGVLLLTFQQYQAIQDRKQQFIFQMGSPDNGFAVEAVRTLSYEGWLRDGVLDGAYLAGANLQGAYMSRADLRNVNLALANLQDATLIEADLSGADFERADLTGAEFYRANLEDVQFFQANLQKVNLSLTNLTGAGLWHSDLRGAYIGRANLRNARFENADMRGVDLLESYFENNRFSEAILPDGTVWTEETDMKRFTDSRHPEYCATLEQINVFREELGVLVLTRKVCEDGS